MNTNTTAHWKNIFEEKAVSLYPSSDPSHDILHIQRVVKIALQLAAEENANLEVIIPAAYFHDFVNVPKNDPRRAQASRLSAEATLQYLASVGYPQTYFKDIAHAIEAHSFSAKIAPTSMEAKIVQDADRLDGLGAIGIARLFATSALLKRPFYNGEDPWHQNRELNDYDFAVDHFFVKLFKLAGSLQTEAGKKEGQMRTEFMKVYIEQLKRELPSGAEFSTN